MWYKDTFQATNRNKIWFGHVLIPHIFIVKRTASQKSLWSKRKKSPLTKAKLKLPFDIILNESFSLLLASFHSFSHLISNPRLISSLKKKKRGNESHWTRTYFRSGSDSRSWKDMGCRCQRISLCCGMSLADDGLMWWLFLSFSLLGVYSVFYPCLSGLEFSGKLWHLWISVVIKSLMKKTWFSVLISLLSFATDVALLRKKMRRENFSK